MLHDAMTKPTRKLTLSRTTLRTLAATASAPGTEKKTEDTVTATKQTQQGPTCLGPA